MSIHSSAFKRHINEFDNNVLIVGFIIAIHTYTHAHTKREDNVCMYVYMCVVVVYLIKITTNGANLYQSHNTVNMNMTV